MFDEVRLQQGSTEWKEFRKSRIAASDVPIILDVSPYKTPYELAMEKLNIKKDERYNPAMQLGHEFEPKIRARVEIDLQRGFPGIVLFKREVPWQMASLDGYNAETGDILEIKYMGRENFEKVKSEGPLEHHKPQLEMQMHVTGSLKAYYIPFVLDETKKKVEDFEIIPVEPGLIDRKEMLKSITDFYNKVIVGKELPEPGDRDCIEIEDPKLKTLAELYLKYKKESADIAKKMDQIKEELFTGATHPVCKISNLKISSYMKKGSVDYKKVQGIDFETYRKPPVLCRRITTLGNK